MNLSKKERLVLLIDSGKNTYREIKENIPDIEDKELRIAASPPINDPETIVHLEGNISGIYKREFKDNDRFYLTEYGQNLFYQAKEKLRLKEQTEESLRLSRESNKLVKLTLFFTIISFLLALWQFVCTR